MRNIDSPFAFAQSWRGKRGHFHAQKTTRISGDGLDIDAAHFANDADARDRAGAGFGEGVGDVWKK